MFPRAAFPCLSLSSLAANNVTQGAGELFVQVSQVLVVTCRPFSWSSRRFGQNPLQDDSGCTRYIGRKKKLELNVEAY